MKPKRKRTIVVNSIENKEKAHMHKRKRSTPIRRLWYASYHIARNLKLNSISAEEAVLCYWFQNRTEEEKTMLFAACDTLHERDTARIPGFLRARG